MPNSRLLAAFSLGGLVGAVIGALLVVSLVSDDGDERGAVLRTGARLFEDGSEMWCNEHFRFCMPRFEDPTEARSFYLGETGETRRQWGCFVEWRPDFPVHDAPAGQPKIGAFRGECSGSTFLRDGTRVFGPSPRDLDEFRVTYHQATELLDGQELDASYLEIDTRTLICGDWNADYPVDRREECELAPAFE